MPAAARKLRFSGGRFRFPSESLDNPRRDHALGIPLLLKSPDRYENDMPPVMKQTVYPSGTRAANDWLAVGQTAQQAP